MKILLIGNGAREHAIGEALKRTPGVELVTYGKARNPGLLELSTQYCLGSLSDFDAITKFARSIKPDFAVIGPDDPIGEGLADALLENEIHSVAPLKTVARLESSKSFTRDLVAKYGIPGNPRYKVFYVLDGVREFIVELDENYVVKADGLMGGKGVVVSGDHLKTIDDGLAFAASAIEKFGRVVVEEKLIGQEFSLMSFTDGTHVSDMVPVQDHKRAFVGDAGPNTGGMGSYSDANGLLPFISQKDLDEAHEITVHVARALFEETGTLFKGIMYGGFMAVANGVRLIEYNARFGDPESLNVLPILKTDFVEICEAIIAGRLNKINVEFEPKATVCKYVVPEGYPDKPRAGERIELLHSQEVLASGEALKQYYAAVDKRNNGLYISSSRAIAYVGIADTLERAESIAEKACQNVKGPVFHREDIGTKKLISQRVEMMARLRKR